MKFKYMWQNECVAEVEYDYKTETVSVVNHTDILIMKPFGNNLNPTWEDLDDFFESRCFPKSRGNAKQLLDDLGLGSIGYDPHAIVEVTHGRLWDDYGWVLFEGEDLDYERDIKLRD